VSSDRTIDAAELSDDLRQLVRESEVTGKRTVFARDGRPVAMLLSHDEYLAMRETIDLSADPELMRDLELAEEEAQRGALLLPEDLFVE
jgi:PHD/YefM family antitoxin component YafN of YafNO toxin-antitoxin module